MKETVDGDKIIAEFMGGRYFESWKNELYHHSDPHWYFEYGEYLSDKVKTQLKYHSSWDWLMPVHKKIYEMNSEGNALFDAKKMGITIWVCKAEISQAFKYIVQFIKWYKQNLNDGNNTSDNKE